ncbi:MAG: hypothetical protein K0B00_09375 [Rhodobacteraceae bacterium]|nr:hypothetical protein [Paracoccaceae bacterium]
MTRDLMAVVFALCAFASPALAADTLRMGELLGDWQGTGSFTSGTDEPGRIRCKITLRATARGTNVVEGRCATSEGSDVFGLEVFEGEAGQITAENRTSEPGNLPAALVGTLEPDLLTLKGEGIAALELRRVGDDLALSIISGQADRPGRMDVQLVRAAP